MSIKVCKIHNCQFEWVRVGQSFYYKCPQCLLTCVPRAADADEEEEWDYEDR